MIPHTAFFSKNPLLVDVDEAVDEVNVNDIRDVLAYKPTKPRIYYWDQLLFPIRSTTY